MSASQSSMMKPPNQQENSQLMKLPQEIRDEVYAYYFNSTQIPFAGRHRISQIRFHGNFKNLSLLSTCHRVREETGNEWLHQIQLHFEDLWFMLDKLTSLPLSIRSQIRHLQIRGTSLQLQAEWQDDEIYYRIPQAMKLVPGINLDVLTVIGDMGDIGTEVNYDTLNLLIRHGSGWKELHYYCPTSQFLGYKEALRLNFGLTDRYLRQPQPVDWQRALEQRDGEASKPSVVIYRSKDPMIAGAVFQEDKRDVLTQDFAPGQHADTYGREEDQFLMRPEERQKEVLVVVKRGAGADHAEWEDPPYLSEEVGDIREHFGVRTWQEVKAKQEELEKGLWSDSDSADGEGQ